MCKQNHVFVSVIVPIYNAEKYLNRCVDSILSQTHTNFELILVDDGSTDNSSAICDAYKIKDKRVVVIHQENAGLSMARNAGLKRATGKYLFFVDSDDRVDAYYIEHLLPESNEDLVYAGYKNVLANGTVVACTHRAELLTCQEIRDHFLQKQITFVWCACYKRDIIHRNAIFFDVSAVLWEDVSFNIRYLECCNLIRFSEYTDYIYYQTPQSLINSFHEGRLEKQKAECACVERFCNSQNYRIRHFYWSAAQRHYLKWIKSGTKDVQSKSRRCLSTTMNDPYFRACIPYIRKHGSLDEKVESFFMRSWLYPFYQPIYNVIILAAKLKNKLIH